MTTGRHTDEPSFCPEITAATRAAVSLDVDEAAATKALFQRAGSLFEPECSVAPAGSTFLSFSSVVEANDVGVVLLRVNRRKFGIFDLHAYRFDGDRPRLAKNRIFFINGCMSFVERGRL